MKARETEADRLRRMRRRFELAMANSCDMADALRLFEREQTAIRAERRAQIRACGRSASAPAAASPVLAQAMRLPIDDSDEGLKWFQK